MLKNNSKLDFARFGFALVTFTVTLLLITSCAHQSKIQPSKGHINSTPTTQTTNQNTAAPIPKLVKSAPQLPVPKAIAKAQTYSVVVNEVPVKEILFALARESKLNIDIHPSIDGRVTLNAVDQTLPAILERLSKQVDLTYKMEGDTLTIRPDAPFLKTYAVNYVNMDRVTTGEVSVSNEIASSVSSALTTGSSNASGESGENTSKTKVTSTSENHFWDSLIKNIKDILQESDKEVLIKRLVSDSTLRDSYRMSDSAKAAGTGSASAGGTTGLNSGSAEGATAAGNEALEATKLASRQAKNASTSKEYQNLFAAQVIANKESGVLSVRATQKQHEKVQEFLDRVQASSKRQVLIEASIVEIQLSDRYQAGVDWSRLGNPGSSSGFTFSQGTGASGSVTSGVTGSATGVAGTNAGLIVGYFNPASALGNIAASVKLLQQFGTTKVLSSPKLMVLNSQTAILKAVENKVYFTISSTPATLSATGTVISPAIFTTTPHTIPVGIWMSVTPQVNENGVVTMNVRPTISRQSDRVQDPNPSLSLNIPSFIPQITVREMESMLQIPSGSTVILGGLMQDEITNTSNGVPGISKAPVIGNAFKARDENATKTELVIFLRPTVIPNASLESDELQSYKQYLPEQQLQNVLEEAN